MSNAKEWRKKKEKRVARLRLKLLDERECGSCTACCTVMAVQELNKPAYTPCKHLCAAGCGIYRTRPGTCRYWNCLWKSCADLKLNERSFTLPESMKPDQCGIMIDVRSRQPFELKGFIKPSVQVLATAYELWPGAAEKNKEVLAGLVEVVPVLVLKPDLTAYLYGFDEEIKVNPVTKEPART